MDTLCVVGDGMTTTMEAAVAGDVWQGALEKIQSHISSQTFETWFRSLGPLEFDGSAMVVWDSGVPPPPTTNTPPTAGSDPHGKPRSQASARQQTSEFLKADGAVVDVCGGSPCLAP